MNGPSWNGEAGDFPIHLCRRRLPIAHLLMLALLPGKRTMTREVAGKGIRGGGLRRGETLESLSKRHRQARRFENAGPDRAATMPPAPIMPLGKRHPYGNSTP